MARFSLSSCSSLDHRRHAHDHDCPVSSNPAHSHTTEAHFAHFALLGLVSWDDGLAKEFRSLSFARFRCEGNRMNKDVSLFPTHQTLTVRNLAPAFWDTHGNVRSPGRRSLRFFQRFSQKCLCAQPLLSLPACLLASLPSLPPAGAARVLLHLLRPRRRERRRRGQSLGTPATRSLRTRTFPSLKNRPNPHPPTP